MKHVFHAILLGIMLILISPFHITGEAQDPDPQTMVAMIREEGLYNWKIYLQARSLENRVPVVACNTLGEILDRKFLGESTIVQFERTPQITPTKIQVERLPRNNPTAKLLQIDVKFPRKLRENRLNEVIHLKDLRVETV